MRGGHLPQGFPSGQAFQQGPPPCAVASPPLTGRRWKLRGWQYGAPAPGPAARSRRGIRPGPRRRGRCGEGAGAAGGSGAEMLNQLIYSDIGPAQGEILGPGLQESGAMVNPVTANPYAGITATPTGSLWDLAKKIPSLPSMPGGGMTGGTGGDSGEGMSLWSDTVNPFSFNPVATGTPRYQAHEATPYGFEDELQRRLAMIRGAL